MKFKFTKKFIWFLIIVFSLHSFLVGRIPEARAYIIAPDPEIANLTGQISDRQTGDILVQASVRLLGRESIEYYLWQDENGQEHNDCVEPLFQSDEWCYKELAQTQTDEQGNYFLECFDVCDLDPTWGYFTDLQAGKQGYLTETENINLVCNQTNQQSFQLEPDVPEWRYDIQPGDILYDPFASGVGHVGLYTGDGWVIEALGVPPLESGYPGKVERSPITSWDYPQRDTVYLLRVTKPSGIEDNVWNQKQQAVINFVYQQYTLNKPYDWHWYTKQYDINSPNWYCSELVWAAYFNQGVDLEFNSLNIPILLPGASPTITNFSPVSPAEIFDDADTETISSHLEGFSSTPWYRQFAPLFVFSPINVIITDKDGNVLDQNSNNIPGATFIEDQIDANGHKYSIIYLPVEQGPYHLEVVRKPDATNDDTYSLKVQTENGDVWLTEDESVPADGQSDEYDFDPITLNTNPASESQSGFNDTEISSDNVYQAGTLDAVFSLVNNFLPTTTPSQIANASATVQNNGTLNFQYKISAENFSGDNELCAALNLQANRNGTEIYNVALTNFFVATSTLATLAADNFDFIASLSAGADASLQNKTCFFDLKLKSWQTGSDDENAGFNDEEILSFSISSGDWSATSAGVALNEFLPDPIDDDSAAKPNGEWVELYNNGDSALDLVGYYLTDLDIEHKIEVESCRTNTGGTIINAHDFLVVYRKGDGSLCTSHNFSLNNDGDTLNFYDSSDVLLDSYSYGATAENKSYARIPDGAGDWVDPIPTPGGPNKIEETQDIITPVSAQSAAGESEFENEEAIKENNNPSEQILEQADEPEEIIEPIVYEPVGDTIQNSEPENILPSAEEVEAENPPAAEPEEIIASPVQESATAVESPAPVSESTIVE